MPIFRVKSVKIYTGPKNLHWRRQWRQWQLSGMPVTRHFNNPTPTNKRSKDTFFSMINIAPSHYHLETNIPQLEWGSDCCWRCIAYKWHPLFPLDTTRNTNVPPSCCVGTQQTIWVLRASNRTTFLPEIHRNTSKLLKITGSGDWDKKHC